MHEVLVNRLGGLSLPRKSVVRLTGRPDMTLDVYRGRKTTIQQQLWQVLSNSYEMTTNVDSFLSYDCFKWDFIALKVDIISLENKTLF